MDEKTKLELMLELNSVDEKIAELKRRWPYHSVQAKMVADLEDLEEEKAQLLNVLDGQHS